MPTLASPENLFTDATLEQHCFPSSKEVTLGDVLTKLAKYCVPFQKLLTDGHRVDKVDTVEMSATNGFTSHLYRCAITMRKAAGNEGKNKEAAEEEFHLIVKVFSMERTDLIMQSLIGKDKLDEFIKKRASEQVLKAGEENGFAGPNQFFAQMHRNECNFYDFIAPDAPIPVPKIYYTQHAHGPPQMQPGLILMEDLSHRAHLASFVEGLNQEEVKAVVKHLSHLHAHLLLATTGAEGSSWKKHFITADQMFSKGNKAGGGGEDDSKAAAAAWIQGVLGQMSEEQRDAFLAPMKRLSKVVVSMDYHVWCRKKLTEEYGIPETLVHGDLWVNNLLWSNEEEPNCRVAAFIDWQMTVRGSPMVDVNRLLAMNTEPEVRHALEREGNLLAFYLKSLNDKLAQSGMEPVGYGVEELQHAYNLAMVFEALACVFVIPFFKKMCATEPDLELKLARIARRATASLADAIKALEKEAPEWLESEEEEQNGEH